MSLGIAFKGAEGVVLAADSRVTLTLPVPGSDPPLFVPSYFDNATKLLRVEGQKFVGAVTYGLGAIGQMQPRTAHSFIPEFEATLAGKFGTERLATSQFAQELSAFFMSQWREQGMPEPAPPGMDMIFFVGGYDEGDPYGKIFEFGIPTRPNPEERQANEFGVLWGGQREFTDRLILGFDPGAPFLLQREFGFSDEQRDKAISVLRANLQAPIPFAFLPLQDCVNLSITLIRTTIAIQAFTTGVRGVGGAIDLATITRTDGIRPIQVKQICGEPE